MNIQEDSSNFNLDGPKPSLKQKQSPQGNSKIVTFQKQDSMIQFEREDSGSGSKSNYQQSNNNNSNNMTPIIKLPLTMVGNVALSKGMYLTLMKRREQRAFGNTSYSSTPRLQTTQQRVQSNKSYSSCARINAPSYSKFNNPQSQHNFKNAKSTSKKTLKVDNEYSLRSLNQSEKSIQYKDIHKTKKIYKESCKRNTTGTGRRRKQSEGSQNGEDSLLKDITDSCLNKNNRNNSGIRSKNKLNTDKNINEKKENNSKISTTKNISKGKQGQQQVQQKSQISSMRERSKQYQNQKENSKINPSQQNSKINSKISKNSKIRDEEEIQDKENQMGSSNLSHSSSSSNSDSKLRKQNELNNPFSGLQESSRNLWHEEALDMQTERAMFIQKIKRDKKKKYSQSPKRCVPGFRVKFETSKSKIFSFNCFRDKDLNIDKQYRDTIDLNLDNDFETDCEQIKESVINVFQSLCVAVCEEKINSQVAGKTQSSIY